MKLSASAMSRDGSVLNKESAMIRRWDHLWWSNKQILLRTSSARYTKRSKLFQLLCLMRTSGWKRMHPKKLLTFAKSRGYRIRARQLSALLLITDRDNLLKKSNQRKLTRKALSSSRLCKIKPSYSK
jgi:hypothetical protein